MPGEERSAPISGIEDPSLLLRRQQSALRRQSTARLLAVQTQHTCSCDTCSEYQERIILALSRLHEQGLTVPRRSAPKEPHQPVSEHTCDCDACDETLAKLEARVEGAREAAGSAAELQLLGFAAGCVPDPHTCGCEACTEILAKLLKDVTVLQRWSKLPSRTLVAAACAVAVLLVGGRVLRTRATC
jgi:hypothetical protein